MEADQRDGWASSDFALARWEPTGGFEPWLPGQVRFQKTTLAVGGGGQPGGTAGVVAVKQEAGCTQLQTEGRGSMGQVVIR